MNKRKQSIINAILWAAAILASAKLGAPDTVTSVVLPVLYWLSQINLNRSSGARG